MPNTMTTAVQAGGTKNGVILTGALRDVYSREVLFNAQPNLIMAQFVDRQTDLTREAGDTIKFIRYDDLRGKTKLEEVENIGKTHLSASMQAIQVDEHGFGVSESERLMRTSWDDTMGRITMLLGQHYGRTVDSMIRDEYRAAGSMQTFFPAAVANRAALTAAHTLNVKVVKDGAERLAVNKAMKIGGAYVSVVHPHQARGLRDDPNWLDAHRYTTPAVNNIFMGEIGMIEGVRFIETTHTAIIKAGSGEVFADGYDTEEVSPLANATLDVYQACMFGGNVVGWAEALPVELRDNGIIDFGRTREIAWYSIMGAGQIRPENAVLLETT